MRICELREKEVINTCDCKVLGCVVDIDFDLCSGQIEAIIVPGPGKVCDIWRGLGIYYPICMYQENRTRYYISGDSERKVFEENIADKRVLISFT